ncbi:MAG: hypothetical protein H0T92_18315 [Pyrinomonadaceae bacterium]|nr:hypothetical protein [Pyrinomonadaceae bacterium]
MLLRVYADPGYSGDEKTHERDSNAEGLAAISFKCAADIVTSTSISIGKASTDF